MGCISSTLADNPPTTTKPDHKPQNPDMSLPNPNAGQGHFINSPGGLGTLFPSSPSFFPYQHLYPVKTSERLIHNHHRASLTNNSISLDR